MCHFQGLKNAFEIFQDSVETASLDSVDHEVVETLQYILDCICAQEESEMEALACFAGERSCSHGQVTLISYMHRTDSEISEKEGLSGFVNVIVVLIAAFHLLHHINVLIYQLLNVISRLFLLLNI